MRNFVVVAVLVFGLCAIAAAQDLPQAEVFGGWSTMVPGETGAPQDKINGWETGFTLNVNQYAAFAADFSGYYTGDDSPNNIHSFLLGPQINIRKTGKFVPYFRALFGASHVDNSDNLTNDNGLTMAVGGGLDYDASKLVSIRMFQLEYITSHFSGDWYPAARVSGGIVLKFGSR